MKQKFLTLGLLTIALFFVTCQKFEIITKLTTVEANATGTLTASAKGKIIELSTASHSQYGFVYSTTANPTIADSKVELGSPKAGDFTGNIAGLTASTTYYIRSFCNEDGSYLYGEQKTFTTTDGKPALTTTAVTAITVTNATSGGNITADGGSAITARGVCWATTANPTLENSKTTDGKGTGIFTSSLTGLTLNTTYYVRAYATNSVGTFYGNEESFFTGLPVLTTLAIINISTTSASIGGNITSVKLIMI
jgi:hypothetical protein